MSDDMTGEGKGCLTSSRKLLVETTLASISKDGLEGMSSNTSASSGVRVEGWACLLRAKGRHPIAFWRPSTVFMRVRAKGCDSVKGFKGIKGVTFETIEDMRRLKSSSPT